MKQLKPRDKITQKMTRDGAVEINETQQTAERISSREADSDFSQPDTATAERVMEHLDAAHTRKASKKAVKKAQEAAVLRTSTSRLQFTDEERETPKLQPYIKKSEKAADKLDAAKAALPKQKKLVKERTFEETAVVISKVCVTKKTATKALKNHLKNMNVSTSCILFFSVTMLISS
jgi:cell envelope opacity-associated protein A